MTAAVRALWLPYEVDDVGTATRFYTKRLGLSIVDRWSRGVVLRAADSAYVELAAIGENGGGPAPLAFELADADAVDAALAGFRPNELLAAARRHKRGHYGFLARGPAETPVMFWSEK